MGNGPEHSWVALAVAMDVGFTIGSSFVVEVCVRVSYFQPVRIRIAFGALMELDALDDWARCCFVERNGSGEGDEKGDGELEQEASHFVEVGGVFVKIARLMCL